VIATARITTVSTVTTTTAAMETADLIVSPPRSMLTPAHVPAWGARLAVPWSDCRVTGELTPVWCVAVRGTCEDTLRDDSNGVERPSCRRWSRSVVEADMKQRSWSPLRPSRLRVAVVGALIGGTMGIASLPAVSASPGRVTICHATGSATNPYVQITVSENAVRDGRGHNRDNHQGGEDIIPPGPDHPGRNWDRAGQTIYNDGCLTFAPDLLPPSL
jgi:hypothetical protein